MTVLVLHPELRFADIRRAFGSAGWHGGPTTATPSLVPAEPELATWRRGGTVARYDCNPVVWLRVLRVSGDDPVPDLPLLDDAAVLSLLRDTDRERQLLGVLAATELRPAGGRALVAVLVATAALPVRDFARHVLATW